MSAENIYSPEYLANEARFRATVKCLDLLRAARLVAPPSVAEHLDRAIAAAEGAHRGYGFRDDELYIEGERARRFAERATT